MEKVDCSAEIEACYRRQDRFPLSLGIQLEEIRAGYARVSMEIKEEMTNFHGITHGGALFALADTAFGLASTPGAGGGSAGKHQLYKGYPPRRSPHRYGAG